MLNTEKIFTEMGAEFVTDSASFSHKLKNVKALIFDWDGVFNQGVKGGVAPSPFSEADSMGINMLRFGYYLLNGQMPYTGIITGEDNPAAFNFAKREHLDTVFFKVKNKVDAVAEYKKYGVSPDEILFVFDDILDISLARVVQARFLIRRKANPLFIDFCKRNGYCDYVSALSGNENGIREVAEVALSHINKLDEAMEKRIDFNGEYETYLEVRAKKKTEIFRRNADGFQKQEM